MELLKPEFKTRTVFPIPGDDTFSVTMRKLQPGQNQRINDRYGYNPFKHSAVKLGKVFLDSVKAAVVSVNGATENGAPMDPTADETKIRLTEVQMEVDGVVMTVWDRCDQLFAQEEEADAKNLLRV